MFHVYDSGQDASTIRPLPPVLILQTRNALSANYFALIQIWCKLIRQVKSRLLLPMVAVRYIQPNLTPCAVD
jgi:hypothetical protein